MSFRNLRGTNSRYPSLSDVAKLPSSRDLECFCDADVEDLTEVTADGDVSWASSSEGEDREEERYNLVEVTQGLSIQLRGSEETREAWRKGECVEAMCYLCNIRLACIQDCDAVACPQCKSVSPVDVCGKTDKSVPRIGGIGLGIRLDK